MKNLTEILLEQRKRVTLAQQRAFARQIDRVIRQTGNRERKRVEGMIRLLQRAKADLSDAAVGLPRGAFKRDMADTLKRELEEAMRRFESETIAEMKKAQEEFALLGQDMADEVIKSQLFSPPLLGIRDEVIENAFQRSADLIRSLSQRHIGRASDVINRGVITGKSTFEVAQELSDEFGKSLGQMETVARTEMLGIHGQASFSQILDMAKTTPGLRKQWITVMDKRTRDDHRDAHLQSVPAADTFKIGGYRLRFPRDPAISPTRGSASQIVNCFPAGTKVEGTFIGATSSFYSGPIITIRTKSGLEVTVTPNHPVLTKSGFSPANILRKGEYLIRHSDRIPGPIGGNVNIKNEPSSIDEVFSSFSKFGRHRKICHARDFHGDGQRISGDIDIVGTTRELLRDRFLSTMAGEDISMSKFFRDLILKGSSMGLAFESSLRSSGLSFERVGISSPAIPSTRTLADNSLSTLGLDTFPLEFFSIGSAANIDSSLYKTWMENSSSDSSLIADLFKRYAGFVSIDEVVDVRNDEFSGHVYDLESPYGWLSANSIIFSNCRCTLIPDFSAVTEQEQLSIIDLPPVQVKLGNVARRVSKSVRKGYRRLR